MRPDARRGAALALVLALLLAASAALVTAGGPARVDQPRIGALSDADRATGPERAAAPVNASQEPELEEQPLPGWLLVVAWVVVGLLALRAARGILRRGVARPDLPPPPDPLAPPPLEHRRGLGALRDAAAAAAEELRARPTADADDVVRCWEQLEDVSAAAGLAPDPAATASELVVALLRDHGADPQATDELLRLYHRARFSSAPLPPDAGQQAARAYEAVAASLDGARA